jgi:hypothetical protein
MSPFKVLPEERSRKWDLLRELVAAWYRPLSEGDGVSSTELDAAEERLGIRLPEALREWYLLAGRRQDIWSRQDALLSPDELHVIDGMLIVYVENQAVVKWGVRKQDLNLDDPSFFVEAIDEPGSWLEEAETISEFAVSMFLHAVRWSDQSAYRANAAGNAIALQAIKARYLHFPVRDWHWPLYPSRVFGAPDILVITEGLADDCWLWIAARTENAFRNLTDTILPCGVDWQGWSEDADPIISPYMPDRTAS